MVEKHVLNDPSTLVVDSLKGLAQLNPGIHFDEAHRGMSWLFHLSSLHDPASWLYLCMWSDQINMQ